MMKELPRDPLSYRPLHEMLIGATRAHLLKSAMSLRVFDVLEPDTFKSGADVAEALGTHPGNTGHFLDTLTTIGLLEKRQGSYRNLPVTEKFLTSGSAYFIGALFSLVRQMSVDSLANVEELVRNGPLPPENQENMADESIWAEGARAGASWVLGEMGCRIASIVSALPGFSAFSKMLDLGGGHGMYALYIVAEHETMKGVVFDQPSVAAVARDFVAQYGMQDRVSAAGGNYLEDDFGTGYDLVWACATLNFAKTNLDRLVSRIYDSINPGGYFISFQDGMTEEKTRPETMLEWLGNIITSGEDMRMERGEIAGSMLRCGFRSVHSRTLSTPMGEMDLDIARR
jgi:predicted O-methyltransferase YrrM